MKAYVKFAARCSAVILLCCMTAPAPAQSQEEVWRFAVSGDSRNCGDVVMPAIAAEVLKHQVDFYWHLGDFRKMYEPDEDMTIRYVKPLKQADYERDAWGDFVSHQITPFGSLSVYLGIGNHELYGNKTRNDFTNFFGYWLDTPELNLQRAADLTQKIQGDSLTYYHWQKRHVDFVSMDNAGDDGFSPKQIEWLEGVLKQDKSDPSVRAIVVGMHRALPNSFSCGHSMNDEDPVNVKPTDSEQSINGGRKVYQALLRWQAETGRNVYVLASHSHFFMEDIYDTPYWKNGAVKGRGVLQGWIVGTAGAQRYGLPANLPPNVRARTVVSGFLLATVSPSGKIEFAFQEVTDREVPKNVRDLFGDPFVEMCFYENKALAPSPLPPSCFDK